MILRLHLKKCAHSESESQIIYIFLKFRKMFPVRCYTCNSVVAHKWKEYTLQKNQSAEYKNLLDEIGFKRLCCRRMFLSHVDIIDDMAMYSSTTTVMDESNTVFDCHNNEHRVVKCN